MQGPEPASGGAARATGPHAHAVWATAPTTWSLTGLLAALGFSFGFYYLNRAGYGVPGESDILGAVAIFDGRWYRQIAVEGYSYDPNRRSNVAFFPVYPLLARGVIWLTGLRAEAALLVVSNLSLLVALWLLARYTREDGDRSIFRRGLLDTPIPAVKQGERAVSVGHRLASCQFERCRSRRELALIRSAVSVRGGCCHAGRSGVERRGIGGSFPAG